MKPILFVMTFLTSILFSNLFSQDTDDLGNNENCILNSEVAIEDIKNGEAKLYLVGGIFPKIVGNENEFEDAYGVFYYDFGCMSPVSHTCLKAYNKEIFLFLDEQYGTEWRSKVRDDVIGVKGHKLPFSSIFK